MTDSRRFFISTFHVGAIYSTANWHGIGLGMDVFYNDAVSNDTNRGLFCKDHDYSTADKIRVGLSLNNELKFGDVAAMVDWGLYLVNPSRHYYARITRSSGMTTDCLSSTGPREPAARRHVTTSVSA